MKQVPLTVIHRHSLVGCLLRQVLQLLVVCALATCLSAQNPVTNQPATSPQVPAFVPVQLPVDFAITQGLMRQNSTLESGNTQALQPGGIQAFTSAGSGINYNGGWIIDGTPVHVYLIWYGNWSGDTAVNILPNFLDGLNQSSYMNILTTYWGQDPKGANGYGNVTNQVTLGGQIFDSYSQGTHLDDTGAKTVMTNALNTFGVDNFGVYVILTSADVQQTMGNSEFCINYCGYHNDTFRDNIDIKYSVIGDPNRCGPSSGCFFGTSAPNGNRSADAMTVVLAHEVAEALTDPRPGNTWVDSNGLEVGDKCVQFVGNIQLSTGVFTTQALWVNTGSGFCAFSYTGPPVPPPVSTSPSPNPTPTPGCAVQPLSGPAGKANKPPCVF